MRVLLAFMYLFSFGVWSVRRAFILFSGCDVLCFGSFRGEKGRRRGGKREERHSLTSSPLPPPSPSWRNSRSAAVVSFVRQRSQRAPRPRSQRRRLTLADRQLRVAQVHGRVLQRRSGRETALRPLELSWKLHVLRVEGCVDLRDLAEELAVCVRVLAVAVAHGVRVVHVGEDPRVLHQLSGHQPLLRQRVETLAQEVLARPRHPRRHRHQRRERRALADRADRRPHRLERLPRRASRQQLDHHAADAPDVALQIVPSVLEHLGCAPEGCALCLVRLLPAAQHLAQRLRHAEVGDLDGGVLVHQDVVSLDVAVHHLVAVQVCDAGQDLRSVLGGRALGQRLVHRAHKAAEGSVADVLHEDVQFLPFVVDVVSVVVHDVLVAVLGQDVHLVAERLDRLLVRDVADVHHLHSHQRPVAPHAQHNLARHARPEHAGPPPPLAHRRRTLAADALPRRHAGATRAHERPRVVQTVALLHGVAGRRVREADAAPLRVCRRVAGR
eukprot:Rhum_TRINITY_DN15165_c8_g1::Rhum_TRINITY_DN15165_c8_g1_i1::g.141678::m.141678